MLPPDFDKSEFIETVDGLPHLVAEAVAPWVAERWREEPGREAWNAICRIWLTELTHCFGPTYGGTESEHFFVVSDTQLGRRKSLIAHAEACRSMLNAILGESFRFAAPGKQIVFAFHSMDAMYRFAEPYFPEGTHGAFSGLHIGGPLPMVLLRDADGAASTLAHELLHASVSHLQLPRWLDEGLAQVFEIDQGHGQAMLLTPEDAKKCRAFWRKRGLADFWSGFAFGLPGNAQRESYQLALILVRLLLDDAKPGFFGFGKSRQRRFIEFMNQAKAEDAGATACQSVLEYPLLELAERFLGSLDPKKHAPSWYRPENEHAN